MSGIPTARRRIDSCIYAHPTPGASVGTRANHGRFRPAFHSYIHPSALDNHNMRLPEPSLVCSRDDHFSFSGVPPRSRRLCQIMGVRLLCQ